MIFAFTGRTAHGAGNRFQGVCGVLVEPLREFFAEKSFGDGVQVFGASVIIYPKEMLIRHSLENGMIRYSAKDKSLVVERPIDFDEFIESDAEHRIRMAVACLRKIVADSDTGRQRIKNFNKEELQLALDDFLSGLSTREDL